MERTPKEDAEEKERKSRVNKPEVFGILAVKPESEKPELSPLEKVLAAIRGPAPEAEEKPVVETEIALEPAAELPVERVPEEEARGIVREMVMARHRPEAEEVTSEIEVEPETEPEVEPIETLEIKPEPIEKPKPVPVAAPEVESVSTVEAEEDDTELEPVERVKPIKIESAETPKVEVEKLAPVEVSAEKPKPPPNDKKKPGVLGSLFRRRGRDKPEKQPEPEPKEALAKTEKTPEGPKFQFNGKAEKDVEEPEEASEETEATPKPKHERIGKMLLHTEATPVEKQPKPAAEAAPKEAEKKTKVETSPLETVSSKRVDTMNRAELMKLGEKIMINGNSLRHIYEAHLIGERGLRRLVAEHLQGGDLSKALRREVMEHEIDFERDPALRDLTVPSALPIDNSHDALEKLLQQANVSVLDNGEQTAVFKAQARHQAASKQRQFRQRRLLDISLAVIITILVALVILIYLTRG
jgi:hypothetical protein